MGEARYDITPGTDPEAWGHFVARLPLEQPCAKLLLLVPPKAETWEADLRGLAPRLSSDICDLDSTAILLRWAGDLPEDVHQAFAERLPDALKESRFELHVCEPGKLLNRQPPWQRESAELEPEETQPWCVGVEKCAFGMMMWRKAEDIEHFVAVEPPWWALAHLQGRVSDVTAELFRHIWGSLRGRALGPGVPYFIYPDEPDRLPKCVRDGGLETALQEFRDLGLLAWSLEGLPGGRTYVSLGLNLPTPLHRRIGVPPAKPVRIPKGKRTPKQGTARTTVRKSAELLGVTERQVQMYIEQGRLEAVKVAGVWMVDSASLAQFERRPPGRPRKTE